jgi:cephalosporin-C deacetylase-like acetyl esterase
MPFDDLLQLRKGGPEMTLGAGPTTLSDATNVEEWHLKASALRELSKEILGAPPERYLTPLEPKTEKEKKCDGYLKKTVSYSVGPNERIRAYLLIPDKKTFPCPAVLTLHQTTPLGKEQTVGNDPSQQAQSFAYGLHLVQRGYITLSYDLLGANERNYPECKSFSTEPFYQQFPSWSVRGKDIWDVSRAVDFLETIPEVDRTRIGAIGHSQGGGITIDAMGLEPRIKAGVSTAATGREN